MPTYFVPSSTASCGPPSCMEWDTTFAPREETRYPRPIQTSVQPRTMPYNGHPLFLNARTGDILRDNFIKVESPCGGGDAYQGCTPLLKNAMRGGEALILDEPPRTHSKCTPYSDDGLYTSAQTGIGCKYSSYADIDFGQLQYYVSDTANTVYTSPAYAIPSTVHHVLKRDPMDMPYMEFERIPAASYHWDDSKDISSFIYDTAMHREDLMSRQQSKTLEQDFSARWFGE